MDYGIRPYVTDEEYVDAVNTVTKQYLRTQGVIKLPDKPYLEPSYPIMQYEATPSEDPLKYMVPTVLDANAAEKAAQDSGTSISPEPVVEEVAAPDAFFTCVPGSGYVPLNVTFTDYSTGTITSWYWDFGDGDSSTSQNPTHTYSTSGTKTATLTVTGPGGTDTYSTSVVVNARVYSCAGPSGITSFCLHDASVTVAFTCGDPGDSMTSFEIVVGDGSVSRSGNNAVYVPGTATAVTLKGTTVGGATCYAYLQTQESCCATCSGATISYTSAQMSVNTTQTLTIAGGSADADCSYVWAIKSGGGKLSATTGASVVYTAPPSNANCALNPTITLSCKGVVIDTLKLAVNGFTNYDQVADPNRYCPQTYYQCKVRSYYGDLYCRAPYNCLGVALTQSQMHDAGKCVTTMSPMMLQCWPNANPLYPEYSVSGNPSCVDGNYYDVRTTFRKSYGCCPAALL